MDRILAAANRAPSAGFSQGYAFLVLETPEQLAPFWQILQDAGEEIDPRLARLRNAPLVILPLSCKQAYLDRYARPDKGWTDRDEARWPVHFWDIDTAFTAMLMLLSAVDQELGALFFGLDQQEYSSIRAQYRIPLEYSPIGVIAIGHPDSDADQSGSARTIRADR